MRRKPLRTAVVAALGLGSLSHCLAPTEIVVWLSTDVGCSDVEQNGLEITAGPAGVDTGGTSYRSSGCAGDGGLGSMVVVPSGGVDGRVGIRVVLGVEAGVGSCSPENQYAGCIVARRELPYSPHTPLILPIDLESSCLGVPCLPGTTCVDKSCVEAGVVCSDGQCDLPDTGAPPPADGGADAGPCFQPLALSAPGAAAIATPRITKAGSTYVIAWATNIGNIEGASVVVSGGTPAVTSGFRVWSGDAGTTTMGPLGTNGTSSYSLTFVQSSQLDWITPPLDGGSSGYSGQPKASVPLEGMIWQPSPGFYTWLGVDTATAGLELFNAATTMSGFTSLPIGSTALHDVSLASSGTTYDIAFFDTACHLYTMSWNGSAFSTPSTLADPPMPGSCASVKVAMTPTFTLAAYSDNTPILSVIRTGETVGTSVETLHDRGAFVPFTVGGGVDVLYLDFTGALQVATFGATNGPSSVTKLTSIAAFSGLPFDAVADDPSSGTGYALTYWDNGTVYFGHSCP